MNVKLHNETLRAFAISFVTIVFASFTIPSLINISAYSSVEEKKFWAGLEGEFEVPRTDTNASGIAMFKSTQDSIWYLINISSIENVTAAHIHSGKLGENGPIVASLFGSDIPTENMNGTLAQGNLTASMLQGSLVGKLLSDLTLAMQSNTTYVNILTKDYPDGEIRGQIMSADSTHAEIMMS